MQNMSNNPQFNQQQINQNMQMNRNMVPLKNPNGALNNLERGSNIFITSNIKQNKEEDSFHVSKLGVLINNENKNNEVKGETFLQQKRLPEPNSQSDSINLLCKKPKIE